MSNYRSPMLLKRCFLRTIDFVNVSMLSLRAISNALGCGAHEEYLHEFLGCGRPRQLIPQVLKPYDELWYYLGPFLSYRVKLAHEIPLGNAPMEQLDELFSELVEVGELCNVVLRVPFHCLLS